MLLLDRLTSCFLFACLTFSFFELDLGESLSHCFYGKHLEVPANLFSSPFGGGGIEGALRRGGVVDDVLRSLGGKMLICMRLCVNPWLGLEEQGVHGGNLPCGMKPWSHHGTQ